MPSIRHRFQQRTPSYSRSGPWPGHKGSDHGPERLKLGAIGAIGATIGAIERALGTIG
jgi:hypothetical protein